MLRPLRPLAARALHTAIAAVAAVELSALPASAQSNLVAAYSFNEGSGTTVADASGKGNTGTIGGATWTTAGKYGGALSFNGTSARVTIPDAPSLRLTTAMTLEAWVRPTSITSAWRDVIYKGNDNYYLEATSTPNSRPAIGGIFGSTNTAVYGTTALPVNTWTHLAASYDGAILRLYVNGSQVSSAARTGTLATSANPLQIGGDNIFGQYFQGTIDDARVYNVALTAAQIQADMNTAVGGGSPAPDVTLTKTHTGSFTQGQTGANYTITVRNSGTGSTSGTVTATDTLPAGMTATAMTGAGWTCTVSTLTCTRGDALTAGASYPAVTLTVNVAGTAPSSVTNTATVSGGGDANAGNNTASDVTAVTQLPDLTLTKTHAGNFAPGQTGATYTLTARNSGTGVTSGTVTVTDALPAGLTATALSGTGWTCTTASLTCTRSDGLAAGTSYPAITLTVTVAANAPASVTNMATVSGGGDADTTNNTASDVTAVTSAPDLTLTKTHTGSFTQGQAGAIYTLTVTNGGSAATSGTVTVNDTLPAGLTARTLSGTGWSCAVTPLSCTRSDVLAAGTSYSPIQLTVDVTNTAPASVTNTATVSGGAETNTANDTASDVTTITANAPPATMTLMQHAGKDAGVTTSSALAFPASNTAGNWIAVLIRAGQRGQSFTVTDTRGNTYRQAFQVNQNGDSVTAAIYYAENIAGGSNTVTVTDSVTGGTLRFVILEYSGIAGVNSLDRTAVAEGTGTAVSSGTATTTANGDLVLAMLVAANGSTMTAGTGFVVQERVPATGTKLAAEDRQQAAAGPIAATATLGTSDVWLAAMATFRPAVSGAPAPPDLTLTKTHTGTFAQGQAGATYALTVTNLAGNGPTAGTVTVSDTLPAALTATAMTGSGWSCTVATVSCTRSDGLAAGAGYPVITLTVNVAGDAPASVTNTATVSGGGDSSSSNNTASDPTSITSPSQDTQAPSAPGTLTANGADNQITLSWSAATDNVGVTSYRVEQCLGAGCSTFSEIATVSSTNAAPMALPLTVSANPNYFKDATGSAIVLNGSQTWNTLQDWGTTSTVQPLDFNAFVNFLVSHGHNFTLLWRTELGKFCGLPTAASSPPDFWVGPHPWMRTGPGTATDGGPKFDLTRFDQAYFDRLRTRVQALRDAGIYTGVYLFTGEWLNAFRCATDGNPLGGSNNINGVDDGGGTGSMTMTAPNAITAFQDAYVEKLVDTLNDLPNVLWIVSEEAPANSTWWNAHQIAHLRTYEGGKSSQHPIGYGVLSDWQDSTLANSDADWVAPFVRISPTSTCGSGTPRCKVNINDSDHSYYNMWRDTAQDNRNYAWENFAAGNQVLFMDPYEVYYPRENRNLCVAPTGGICSSPDARWDNFRDNLGYVGRYARKLNLDSVTPRASLCSTGYCLAQTPSAGAEYLVYAPNGGSFTVDLSAMAASRTLNVEWLNPSTGQTTIGAAVAAGSSARSFTPPFSGDAVLYLVDSSGHHTSATTPTSIAYTVTNLSPGTYGYRVRAADAAGNIGSYSNVASATIANGSTPDLMLTKTHAGSFTQGQSGASYMLTASNVGTAATSGTVTVTDTLPTGLTATAVSGTGWSCTLATLTCTRNDALAAGASYAAITLTVNVATNAPSSVTNSASVNGGGESNSANDTATDVTAIASQTSSTGLVAAYAFNEATGATVTDASGNGNTGTVSGTAWTTTGKYGAALSFNGTNARVTVPDAPALRLTNAMTLEAWVRPSTVTSAWRDVIYKANDNYFLEATSTNSSRPAGGGTIGAAYGTSALAVNTWTHLAVTYDRANIRLYVNGALVSTAASTAALTTSANPLQIGGDTLYAQYFQGLIDEIRVYNVALTAAQIQADMNTPVGGSAPPPPDLTLTKTHAGSFAQGQTGATYTVTVSNTGAGATTGSVTVTDSLPGGLTATALTGAGWTCTVATLTCNRSDALAAGAGYAPITLTVDVASTAPASVTNTATVTGGGDSSSANNTASDPTTITTATSFSVSPRTTVITSTQTQTFSAGGAAGLLWAVDNVVGGTASSGTITTDGVYTPPPDAGSHTVTAMSGDQQQSANATVYVSNYAGTYTRDVDTLRTGLNPNETVLTPANVNASQFGKLFGYQIDGVSDASPLYVANVNIPGVGLRNVVYVATEHDSVYAFDADGRQTAPLWKVSFIDPAHGVTTVPPADTGEPGDISPEIGITGSPVIDASTNTLYVVAKTKEVSGGTAYRHRLHALDIATGAEKFGGPRIIQASAPGTGDGAVNGMVPFISLRENQRAALLLSGGVVYIAFAGHGDQPPYHGWILGYRASDLQQVMAFATTPNGEGGGVWQSGDGLATDTTGNVFFVSGDGTFDAASGGTNFGDSFLKISPTGAVLDYFTPHDQASMDAYDLDLGSGGTTLLPDQPGPHPHLAISAGKNGTIYLVDRDNMGHFNASNDSQIVQTLVNIFPNGGFTTGNFKAPVYWNSRLYFSADADYIKSFQVSNGRLSTSPSSQSSFIANYPGSTLSLSANGVSDGILWAIERIDQDPLGGGTRRPGVLHAFDAINLGIELYRSDQAPAGRDGLDYAAKWAAPLIANGKVFVATNGRLTAFGLLP